MGKITVKSMPEHIMTIAIGKASYWVSEFHRPVFQVQKLLELKLHLTFNVSELMDPKSEFSHWWIQRNG